MINSVSYVRVIRVRVSREGSQRKNFKNFRVDESFFSKLETLSMSDLLVVGNRASCLLLLPQRQGHNRVGAFGELA